MFENLVDGGAFVRSYPQDHFYQPDLFVFYHRLSSTETFAEEYLGFHLVQHFLRAFASERRLARDHFEQQYAQRPYVNLVVV